MHVELRRTGNPTGLLPEVRSAVREFGPDLPLLEPMTQQAPVSTAPLPMSACRRDWLCPSARRPRFWSRRDFTGHCPIEWAAEPLKSAYEWLWAHSGGKYSGWYFERVWVLVWRCFRSAYLWLSPCTRVLRSMLFVLAPRLLAFVVAVLGLAAVVPAASVIPARRAATVDLMVVFAGGIELSAVSGQLPT